MRKTEVSVFIVGRERRERLWEAVNLQNYQSVPNLEYNSIE
jgi:hypothetical protein